MQAAIEAIRSDFPELSVRVHGKPLVYFDNGASSLKPSVVIDRISSYYASEHANVHRGVHALSQGATDAFEEARGIVARHLGVSEVNEIVFTKGTTESINLLASGIAHLLQDGDEVILSALEHHANIVPWFLACKHSGARLIVCPLDDDNCIDHQRLSELVNDRTKVIALTHISNVTAAETDLTHVVEIAAGVGALVCIDGAQGVLHGPLQLEKLGVDAYAFSGHKLYGPTGVGVLYAKSSVLERLPPYQGGGDMIDYVSFENITFAQPPHKFEAGTPNIAGVIGLGAALNYLNRIGWNTVIEQETSLSAYMLSHFQKWDRVRLHRCTDSAVPLFTFSVTGIHPYDLGAVLDRYGIAIRTGHHCAQPLMRTLGVESTARASLSFYNTHSEVDYFFDALHRAIQLIG